jgi:hypothetical protein
MCEWRSEKRDKQRELLQELHDKLDSLGSSLAGLVSPGKAEVIDLLVELRLKINQEFSRVMRDSDPTSDAS